MTAARPIALACAWLIACGSDQRGTATMISGFEHDAAARDAAPPASRGAASTHLDAAARDASETPGPLDSAVIDAAPALDAAAPGGDEDSGVDRCSGALPLLEQAASRLSEAGLYADVAGKVVARGMQPYEPRFALWSDGADKARWLYLPPCATIDTNDMDNWSFPIGTRAYKEFSIEGRRIETRLVHRYGPGRDDFLFAHYLWNDDETAAHLVTAATAPETLAGRRDSDYHVPDAASCVRCHGQSGGDEGGMPSRYLGLSAIQLGHDRPGETIASLSAAGRLSRPRPAGFAIPGGAEHQAALGYLHANCGHCHNASVDGVHFPAQPLSLLLTTEAAFLHETDTYVTAVGVEVLGYGGACTHRVHVDDPGLSSPATGPVLSCVHERMATRDDSAAQMPPLATHRIDPEGMAVIARWIGGL